MIEPLFIKEEFWLESSSTKIGSIISETSHFGSVLFEPKYFYEISELVRDIIDFRSNFTATHSTGVATSASLLAKKMGLTQRKVLQMKIAGNVHDLGKLAIPNSILNKQGALTEEEFAKVRQHTYYTYVFLKQAGFPQNIIEWASFHHEKLNGNGYPFNFKSEDIDWGARILVVADIFTALQEDRPYRKGMGKEQLLKILHEKVSYNDIDITIVKLLEENYDEIVTITKMEQEKVNKDYLQLLDLEED